MSKKLPKVVTILILTLITVVFWIFFNVYRVFTNQPSNEVPLEIINPLNPNLDTQVIDEMMSRDFIE